MNRTRDRFPRLGALCGLWLLALGAAGCSPKPSPPVVLLLTSDTLRSDRLGAYGSTLGLTPHLDALLEEATVFEAAYAPCSYTLPSASTILTGRYPEELGMLTNVSALRSGFPTLAEVFGLSGWRTGAVVSNYVLRRGTGVELGFELFDDTFPQLEANRDMPERIGPDTTDAALALVDRLADSGQPVLLWVHYQDPHGPYLPGEARRARYLEIEREQPDGQRQLSVGKLGVGAIPEYQLVAGEFEVAFYRAGYDGEVAWLDEEIGRLFDGLRARGLWSDTVVAFTADHGESLGETDYWFAHGEYLSDPLVRVPLAFRVPGRPPARVAEPVSLVDVFPTLLGYAGLPVLESYPGRDLLAESLPDDGRSIYVATLRGATKARYAVIHGRHKYVLTAGEGDARGEELYALGDETRNLVEQEPTRAAELRQRLQEVRSGLARPPEERRQQLDEAERQRLRQLGYVVD
ncbi:MAG: sulfatase-like hydrolase/transferase [Proteobacteria bacterium]|nr:sulfatase-like hydrolase/transferase [Pseudomonadota bacterium]